MGSKYNISDDGTIFEIKEDGSISRIAKVSDDGDICKLDTNGAVITEKPQIEHTSFSTKKHRHILQPYNYLFISFLATVICTPLGIIALINARRVDVRWMQGNFKGAEKASRLALIWSFVSFIVVGFLFIWVTIVM